MSADGFESETGYFHVNTVGNAAVAVFTVQHLTEERNIEQLGHDLVALVEKHGYPRVVLDLSSVEYATSAVIGKWIMLHRKLDREGGKMAICGVQPSLSDILQTAHLLDYFHAMPDVTSAVDYVMNPPRQESTDDQETDS